MAKGLIYLKKKMVVCYRNKLAATKKNIEYDNR